jgi:hypothetical protein
MIMRFNPNEKIVEGFRRVASASKSKLKQYLLKKAGLSSHDIRLLTDECQPIKPWDIPVGDEFFYSRFFNRSVHNSPFYIVNASGTSPVIREMHFFLSIPNDLPLYFPHESGEGSTSDYSVRKSFLEHNKKDEAGMIRLPVLGKGEVILVPEHTFGAAVSLKLNPEVSQKLNNDRDYLPPKDLTDQCRSAYNELINRAPVWVGLVLDNEELLPYKWDHESQRYEPGFFTDATTLSS